MATNRLRKRLDDTEESSLSRMTENFCLIGTPLPSLDKRDANEYKPVWEQEVRDEQGRRRFHGAFTGGFSAGYYNSVGSKEGWAPSTFRSSRKDKEKIGRGEGTSQGRSGTGAAAGSRPEDFMDEEDLEALREGRGALGSTQTYQMQQEESQQQRERDPLMHMLGLTSERRSATAATSGEKVTSIQMASQSLGVRVLQKMGWRPGQGLGPRVTFKKRRKLLAMLGFSSCKEEEDDKEAEKHLWPPPDTPMPTFSTKNDAAGLGWVRQSREGRLDEALKSARADASRDTHKTEARSGGFGLGALEDDSDGEDDVYATGHRIEDSSLARPTPRWEDGRDRVVLGDPALKVGPKSSPTGANIGSVNYQDSNDNVWHDGRSVLSGFRIASKASLMDEPWFVAPEVPEGWTPNPQLVWSQAATVTKGKVSGSNMTSSERASILGEARLPGPPPAISDYLSQKEREKVERGKAVAAEVAAGASEAVRKEGPPPMSIPRLDADVAKSALQGFIPFENEPTKQARYRAYLESQVNPSSKTPRPTSSQSEGQFINELREFAKSAGIFKPLSTVMASRFQSSAGGSNDLPQINPGLFIPERKPALSVDEERAKARLEKAEEEEKRKTEELKTLTAAQRNARLNLFGEGKTRDVKIWKPSRLLCKRFNVPEPYPEQDEKSNGKGGEEEGGGNVAGSEALEAAFGASKVKKMGMPNINTRWEESKRQLQQLASLRTTPSQDPSFAMEGDAAPSEGQKESRAGVVDVGNIGLGEVQPDKDEEVYDKPSIDIFKAVFADDDESSDDDDDDEKNDKAADDMTMSSAKPFTTTNGEKAGAASQEERVNTAGISRTDEDHKLLFVPRKRRADDEDKLKKREGKKDGERKSKKSKSMTLLTFSVDDEEESEAQAKQADRKLAKRENRPRAADLFQ